MSTRKLANWTWHELRPVGWLMSLVASDRVVLRVLGGGFVEPLREAQGDAGLGHVQLRDDDSFGRRYRHSSRAGLVRTADWKQRAATAKGGEGKESLG